MWIAERKAISPRNEEHAAMAYKKSERFESQKEAKAALVNMVFAEVEGWVSMGMPADREWEVLKALVNADSAEFGNIRWAIREF